MEDGALADARSPQQSAQTVIRRCTWDAAKQTLGAATTTLENPGAILVFAASAPVN